jgi:hypothetical protein
MLLAATAALILSAGAALAASGTADSGTTPNSFPAGFYDGNLNAQTGLRLQKAVAEHEQAVLAARARQQQPSTISATPRVRPAGG